MREAPRVNGLQSSRPRKPGDDQARPGGWGARFALEIGMLGGLAALAVGACMTATWSPGERVARAKCGACHLRPRPGQHSRAALERILDEHQSRSPLSADQRARLLDWLAPEPAPRPATRPGAGPEARAVPEGQLVRPRRP